VSKRPIVDQDARRKRALIVWQIIIYGYLLALFLIQLHMYAHRDW
jgi:hypothetical protein